MSTKYLPYDKDGILSIDADYAIRNWSFDFCIKDGAVNTAEIKVLFENDEIGDISELLVDTDSPLRQHLIRIFSEESAYNPFKKKNE